LFSQKVSKQEFSALRSIKQKIVQVNCEQTSFSPLHYSRYLLGDYGIESVPFGYKHMSPQKIESVENEAKIIEQSVLKTNVHK